MTRTLNIQVERRKPTQTFYPDDTMMSDETDDTSFPAVHTGPTGQMPDAPPDLPEYVTTRPWPQMYPPPAVDTPDPREDAPVSWKTWLTPWTWGEDKAMAQPGLGSHHQQGPPAYPEDMYVQASGPETLTIS